MITSRSDLIERSLYTMLQLLAKYMYRDLHFAKVFLPKFHNPYLPNFYNSNFLPYGMQHDSLCSVMLCLRSQSAGMEPANVMTLPKSTTYGHNGKEE